MRILPRKPKVAKETGKRILITGGTGSFGREMLKRLVNKENHIERIVIYSRDELKQWEMQQQFPAENYPQIRFLLGDIRDRPRLERALETIDTVIHAAALKQVPAAEYNPMEFIKTNVIGADNLINACLTTEVNNVVALSTDKAAAPINLYGATKLCSDKLFVAANNIKGQRNLKFSVVRYGNVMGSRGSVIPYFMNQALKKVITITDKSMSRFNITLREGVEMVEWALQNSLGGEIFVPKIPSYKITDLADAISPSSEKRIIGVRPGEKIHEEMITKADSFNTIDLGKYYAILPSDEILSNEYKDRKIPHTQVKSGFAYNSGTNPDFLTKSEIVELIKENIDCNFAPI